MKRTCLFLLLVPALCSCFHRAVVEPDYASVAYAQTYCSDPWETGITDENTATIAKHYLDSLGLSAVTVSLRNENSPDLCKACTCKTGKIVYVLSLEEKVPQYEKYGFVRR